MVEIKTSKEIHPKIYAYTTPTVTSNEGWIKIGYTERDVRQRIKEQTHTAHIATDVLWTGDAAYTEEPDKGKTFKIIKEALEKNNYKIKYQVLNAKNYGNIPQNRERIYIVGFKNEEHFKNFEFPFPLELTRNIEDMLEKNNIDEKYYYSKEKNKFYDTLEKEITNENTIYQWRRRYVRENKSNVCPTLTANMGTGGHNVPLIRVKERIRKLTPRECFNFQGYPKDFKLPDLAPSHLYKQAGNSVVVPVIKRIAENIFKALEEFNVSFEIKVINYLKSKNINTYDEFLNFIEEKQMKLFKKNCTYKTY